jgi:glycosyltransferase involved in cell wall biosynthesis
MEANIEKKKVIAFIDWYVPGYKAGGGQRAFANFVAYMREYYDFYIITRNTDFMESQPYEKIQSDIWTKRNDGESVYYASEWKIGYRLFNKLLKEVKPDFAYVNGVYSYQFSILPLVVLKLSGFNGKVLQGTYGMLAQSAINIKKGKKQLFLTGAKVFGLYQKVVFHSTSQGETADIRRVFGVKAPIMMAAHFPNKQMPLRMSIAKRPGELRLISVARISPEKNTLYALECLREMGEIKGEIVFDMYGPVYDQDYWSECQKVINTLPRNIKVSYCGLLDGKEVIGKMMAYHCLFMPSRGENFGYVILEAFMAARPVMISDRTPWNHLEQQHAGYDLPLDDMNRFCDVISLLVAFDQKTFDHWCDGAEKRALAFINNTELMVVNQHLFEV